LYSSAGDRNGEGSIVILVTNRFLSIATGMFYLVFMMIMAGGVLFLG